MDPFAGLVNFGTTTSGHPELATNVVKSEHIALFIERAVDAAWRLHFNQSTPTKKERHPYGVFCTKTRRSQLTGCKLNHVDTGLFTHQPRSMVATAHADYPSGI
eukprot:873794-Amphidinium_carterae.1